MDPQYTKDLVNLEQRVQALCDVQRIKQTYLNPSQIDMGELKKLMDEERDEDKDSFSIVDEEEAKQQCVHELGFGEAPWRFDGFTFFFLSLNSRSIVRN